MQKSQNTIFNLNSLNHETMFKLTLLFLRTSQKLYKYYKIPTLVIIMVISSKNYLSIPF